MTDLSDELEANAFSFRETWSTEIVSNIAALSQDSKFMDSYRRIAAIQALKAFLVAPQYSTDAVCFYAEAQNDALTSHVFASMGAWRASLQSLRSCIENMLGSHYFNDHPVEFKLWSRGGFRLGFSETLQYFGKHPDLEDFDDTLSGLEVLKQEYATLSKAVHGSAVAFRMTDSAARLLLWSTEASKLGAWSTRQKKVLEALALLTVCLHHERLKGAALPQLRAVLGYVIGEAKRSKLKSLLHIHIDTPA